MVGIAFFGLQSAENERIGRISNNFIVPEIEKIFSKKKIIFFGGGDITRSEFKYFGTRFTVAHPKKCIFDARNFLNKSLPPFQSFESATCRRPFGDRFSSANLRTNKTPHLRRIWPQREMRSNMEKQPLGVQDYPKLPTEGKTKPKGPRRLPRDI